MSKHTSLPDAVAAAMADDIEAMIRPSQQRAAAILAAVAACPQAMPWLAKLPFGKGSNLAAEIEQFNREGDEILDADNAIVATIRDDRELATVLAALRLWQQRDHVDSMSDDLMDIATDGASLEPLSYEEIDALCERLNCGG